MNLQQIFDTGVRGIRAQGRLSKTDDGCCMYRNNDGSVCALGHSISDDDYSIAFENIAPTFLDSVTPSTTAALARILGAKTEADCDKLRKFQNCHDHATDVRDFLARCASFADRYDLNKDVLTNA